MATEMNTDDTRQACRNLRTKIFYVSGGKTLDDITESSATSQYWCLKTMMIVGPEGMLAHPENCISGCDCYDC